MNDYWNDPPEEPEMPECCNEVMTLRDNGDCVCETCSKVIPRPPDIEPTPDIELPDDVDIINKCRTCGKATECVYCSDACVQPCVHGNKVDCEHCYHLSDLAFDAARESR